MTAYRARLTEFDIRRLIKSTDEDERAAATHKLCRNMERVELTPEDREAAEKILRVLAHDAAELVRRAMAVTVRRAVAPRSKRTRASASWRPATGSDVAQAAAVAARQRPAPLSSASSAMMIIII